MIKTNNIINELRNINSQFLVNNKNGLKINNKNYKYKIGANPIILSAPHAVKQCRNQNIKAIDYLTGALAIYLANKCNCSFVVRTFNDNDDPNFPLGYTLSQVDNDYLILLKKLVKFYSQFLVIDLHGCTNSKKYDCSLWHDNYKNCNIEIVKIFEDNFVVNGITVDHGREYLGGQVTRQCSLITDAFQLEIKRKIRSLKIENVDLLISFINSMSDSIEKTSTFVKKLQKGGVK